MTAPNSNEIEIRIVARDGSGDNLDRLLSRVDAFTNRVRDSFGRAGSDAGDRFNRGLDDRIGQDPNRRGRSGISSLFDKILAAAAETGQHMGRILMQAFGGFGGAIGAIIAGGPLSVLAAVLLAIVAAAAAVEVALLALAPVVLLVGGAFGAAATAGFGLVAMVGALIGGLGGLGEAWTAHGQKASGGGRSSAAAAREVKNATEALADAQRAAVRAAEDVNRARADEAERLEDLSRALSGAMLDEEGATLAVKRARERLNEARHGGTALDRQEADLGYRKALLSLEEVRDRVGDLKREKAEADAKGVEGSDRVQAALERQMLAQRHLEDATARLADVQRGAGGGVDKFAEAMANLSLNGQALMTTLFALQPAFTQLRKATQDRLLSGMDTAIKDLVTKWLPDLDAMLGGLAHNLNTLVKGIFTKISTPQFITDIRVAVAGFGTSMERMGQGVEALLGAFGRLARASVPFWMKLVDLISGSFEKFEAWIAEADKSGALDDFIGSAVRGLQTLWEILGLVKELTVLWIETLMGPSKREAGGFLDMVKDGLESMRDWLADPENQQKIRDWITDIQDFGDKVGEAMATVADWIGKIEGWVEKIDKFVDAVGSIPDRIRNNAKGMFDGIKDAFRSALNWIIDRWNGLEFRLPSITVFGQQVGGGVLATPNIPHLASGGIGGGLARVAERGRELIHTPDGGMLLAMPHGSTVIPNGTTEAMLGRGAGGEVVVRFDFAKAGMDEMRRLLMKIVDVYGNGNVQVAIGKGSA